MEVRFDGRQKDLAKAAFDLTFWMEPVCISAIPTVMTPDELKDGRLIHLPIDDVLHIDIGAKP